jgi:Plant transposon protein
LAEAQIRVSQSSTKTLFDPKNSRRRSEASHLQDATQSSHLQDATQSHLQRRNMDEDDIPHADEEFYNELLFFVEHMLDDDEDEDNQELMAYALAVMDSSSDEDDTAAPRRKGRAPNKERDFELAYDQVMKDYFSGPESIYNETDFERRFRVPRSVFNVIHDRLMGMDPFLRKKDCFGNKGIYPLVKLVASFRFLAYGDSYDREDENLRIAESTLNAIVRLFCKLLIKQFGGQYLNRVPTLEEKKVISSVMESRGFPGCIGSWDCKHFQWKNCPLRLAGQYQGHALGGKKTIILEAIADHRRYIWQANFGDAGALNDINVLDRSSIVGSLLTGDFSIKSEPYDINGNSRDWNYFLVDGIYPEWSIFVNTYTNPIEPKKRTFAKKQESARKDVECAFGVLVQRFHVLQRPLRGWYQEDLVNIVHACVILHNMVVDERSGTLQLDETVTNLPNGPFALFGRRELTNSDVVLEGIDLFAARVAAFDIRLESSVEHYKLKHDLVEHNSKN